MKAILIILVIILLIVGIIFLVKKYSGGAASNPSLDASHSGFIQACTTPPYNNPSSSCEQAWTIAQGLGISDYAGWAKYQCDQGHC